MSRRVSKNISISSSDDDEKKISKIRSRKSSSSSEQSKISNRQKSPDKKITFRSPSQQLKSSDESSSDASFKNRPVSRPQSNLRKQNQLSDSDSASDSTIKKSIKSSCESLDKPRNSRKNDKKRQILRSSSSSRSRSNSSYNSEKKANSDSDADSSLGSSILKIKIESKPPIDKNRHHRKISSRQSNFEKPDSDSESESKLSDRSKTRKKISQNLDSDSQDSNNEMTDVSSLSSPKETKIRIKSEKFVEDESISRGRSAFYSALHQKSHTRPNSVNFNFSQNYTNLTEFSERTYGRELMRIEAQQRRIYNEFLKENRGKSAKIDRPLRLTSSAINRQKEQQRIEKENQLILKRLLSVKSSKEVRKENQLKDYEKNMGIADLNLSRNSIKSGLSTKRSQKSSLCNSRISSAKSNRSIIPFEFSNRTLSLSRKPEWNSKW